MMALRRSGAFILAPAASAGLATCCLLFFGWRYAFALGLSSLILGYVVALIFGLPAYLMLKHFRSRHILTHAAAGLTIGLILFILFDGLDRVQLVRSFADLNMLSLHFLILFECTAASVIYWLLARPDRLERTYDGVFD